MQQKRSRVNLVLGSFSRNTHVRSRRKEAVEGITMKGNMLALIGQESVRVGVSTTVRTQADSSFSFAKYCPKLLRTCDNQFPLVEQGMHGLSQCALPWKMVCHAKDEDTVLLLRIEAATSFGLRDARRNSAQVASLDLPMRSCLVRQKNKASRRPSLQQKIKKGRRVGQELRGSRERSDVEGFEHRSRPRQAGARTRLGGGDRVWRCTDM